MPELTEKEQALYHEIKKIGPEGLLRSNMDKDQILIAEKLFKRSILMKGTTKEKRVAYFLPACLWNFAECKNQKPAIEMISNSKVASAECRKENRRSQQEDT